MRTIVLGGVLGIAIASSAFALTVEEAYRLVPHRQTTFQSASARMPTPQRAYLAAFFAAIDQAIVAKVSARRDISVAQAYAPVWDAWEKLNPPALLRAIQSKVKMAILDQQAFLLEVERNQSTWSMNHPKVRSASANLQAAYGDLMRIYSSEDSTNKQAFFDYLCALDFL